MFLKIQIKKLNLWHKLWFSYLYFYATQYHKPFKLFILQLEIFKVYTIRLQDIGIWNLEFDEI